MRSKHMILGIVGLILLTPALAEGPMTLPNTKIVWKYLRTEPLKKLPDSKGCVYQGDVYDLNGKFQQKIEFLKRTPINEPCPNYR